MGSGMFYPDQVFAPSRGVLGDQALEASFQLLIEAFGLAIGLWVIPHGQAGCSYDEPAEIPPEPGHELVPPVRDDVLGKPVDSENAVHHDLHRFLGGGQLRQ